MESVWEAAAAAAVKVRRRSADVATSPNRADVRWLGRQPWGDEGDAAPFAGSQVLLGEVVQEALCDVATLLREQAIELVVQAPCGGGLADRGRLRQALANAIQYNRPGGTVEIGGLRAEHAGNPMPVPVA